MTENTQYKTLVNTWLIEKRPMITPSTHANFVLIAENHLIPYFGRKKIGTITETDIQEYITHLYNEGRLDGAGGITVKSIRDIILVLRLSLHYAYKERIVPLLNWDLIEYPKDTGVKKVVSLSKEQELALIQCIYMDLNRRTAGILVALFTGLRIGELCGMWMRKLLYQDDDFNFEEERLATAYAELPLMRQQILKFLYVDELTVGEIAKKLHCSAQYVSDQKQKGLKHLRKKMSEGGDDNG